MADNNFWHEKLNVYQRAIALDGRFGDLIEKTSQIYAYIDHLDRASEVSARANTSR